MTRNRRQGFLAIPRELFDLPLWEADAPLQWVFFRLCFQANFAPGEVEFNGRRHALERGEVVTSSRALAARSGFTRKVIRRCIATLQKEGLIGFRQEFQKGPAAPEKGPAKGPAETVYIINNYAELFDISNSKGPSKGPSDTPKRAQRTKSLPLYVSKNKKHTHTAREGVCVPSVDEGKPASQPTETSQTPPASSFLEHPIVIEWNNACEGSKLERVSEDTPARMRALEAAFRFRSDPLWWRGVFGQATKPITINGKPWRPSFDQCLELDRAVRYHETGRKVSHLRPAPKPPIGEPPVEFDSRNGASRHVPEKSEKPRDLSRQLAAVASFRRSIAPEDLDRDGGVSETGA